MAKLPALLIISATALIFAACSQISRAVESSAQPAPTAAVQPKTSDSPTNQILPKKIDVAKITAVSLKAQYRSFFEENSKCRKSYDELFGNADGYYNANSPCVETISFDRNGHATKTIELGRYDKSAGQMRTIEKLVYTANIGDKEFETLTAAIAVDDFIINYLEGLEIYTSNFNIKIAEEGGQVKTFAGNADNEKSLSTPIIAAIINLDRAADWLKTE